MEHAIAQRVPSSPGPSRWLATVILLCVGIRGSVSTVFHAYPDERCEKGLIQTKACQQGGQSFADCIASLHQPGDECRLHAGRYYFQGEPLQIRGLHGINVTSLETIPYVIAAYPGDEGKVFLDGTAPATTQQWQSLGGTRSHIFVAAANQDMWQLFVDGDMQTNARWPNALWSDKSVFNVSYWASSSNASTVGTMVDDGTKGLAKSGLDVTGAIAVLNIGSWNTYPKTVLHHQRGSSNFTYNSTGLFFHQPPMLNHYFLEDMLEFLDQPTEWYYDPAEKKVYLWPDDGKDPGKRDVRGKVSTYSLNITNCSKVILANMSFFATTIWAASLTSDGSYIDNLSFRNLNFSYPSYSKRILHSTQPPLLTFISSEPVVFHPDSGETTYPQLEDTERRRYLAMFSESSIKETANTEHGHHLIFNCSWMFTDGAALIHTATGSHIANNLFAYNDWSAASVVKAGDGVGTVDNKLGWQETFMHNTLYRNGASVGYKPPGHSIVRYNHIINQCWGDIQHDGSGIQVMKHAQNLTFVSLNWIHDSVKLGIRFDGDPPSGFGYNGFMANNVVWNCGGLQVKGDNHTIEHNLVFSRHAEPKSHGAGCTLCVPKYDRFYPNLINRYTVTSYNAGDPHSINGGNWTGGHPRTNGTVYPLPGPANNNVQSIVNYEMYDPGNLDFRPLSNSTYCKQTEPAGAYTCSADYDWYWIPGRRLHKASTPVPPDGSQTVKPDRDVVMWLPALGAVTQKVTFSQLQHNNCSHQRQDNSHSVEKNFSAQINGVTNVFHLPKKLESKTTYCWHVGTQLEDGSSSESDSWSFTTQ